jgi:hypothetical protein
MNITPLALPPWKFLHRKLAGGRSEHWPAAWRRFFYIEKNTLPRFPASVYETSRAPSWVFLLVKKENNKSPVRETLYDSVLDPLLISI